MMMINHHDLLPVVYNLEKDKGLEQHSLYNTYSLSSFRLKMLRCLKRYTQTAKDVKQNIATVRCSENPEEKKDHDTHFSTSHNMSQFLFHPKKWKCKCYITG